MDLNQMSSGFPPCPCPRCCWAPRLRAEVHGLDLRDATELDAKAEAQSSVAPPPHRAHHCDLSELGVGEDVFVITDALAVFQKPSPTLIIW